MLRNGYLTTPVSDLAAQTQRSTASVYLKANELELIKTQKRRPSEQRRDTDLAPAPEIVGEPQSEG